MISGSVVVSAESAITVEQANREAAATLYAAVGNDDRNIEMTPQ